MKTANGLVERGKTAQRNESHFSIKWRVLLALLIFLVGCSDVSFYTGIDYTPRVDEYPSSYTYSFGVFYRLGNEPVDDSYEDIAGLPALRNSQR